MLSVVGEVQGAVAPTYAMYPFQSIGLPLSGSTSVVTPTTTPTTGPGSDWMFTGKNLFRVRRLGGWFGGATPALEGEEEMDLGLALARDVKGRAGT